MAFNNWHDFFLSRVDNKAENKNTTVFLAAWAQANANDAKLALLTNDASTAILVIDATNKVVIVHSVWNFGGTILHPANHLGALIGNGCIASTVIVDKASFLQHVNTTTPPFHSIIACLDKAEIEAIPHPIRQAVQNFHTIASFLPAPWLLTAVSGANTSDPALLILAASEAAANFDQLEHANDTEYLSNSEEQLKDFALWAWCAMAGRIPRLIYLVDLNNDALRNYGDQRHHSIFPHNKAQGI
jgi:hypothetical protein